MMELVPIGLDIFCGASCLTGPELLAPAVLPAVVFGVCGGTGRLTEEAEGCDLLSAASMAAANASSSSSK